ncbi:MAG: glycoside hydrolase family 99-like domain-containing protein [Candidatus Dormibacteraeota bacterium]|uniref:Glycoside hydrolase family 99-like domain-containing protein n=1 Tax=Candidatus Amunia macphersoniae TaxID=3127014 RepID=A0A934KHZ0_9BACT|nr:glycoside hydrolase family 99-like domain-containing protein [Candidatus Dormibacteraeota bacterium]
MGPSKPTTIAFYLPQFHPIPENDGWYGKGFTEWRNVVNARPLFPGHYQPHIPSDLGFYDLRVPETREQQARMASAHGIDAFCYYHYWFESHRPLHRVIDEVMQYNAPDMPFCLAWANENWSRHWDATAHEVLLKQTYNEADDDAHAVFLGQAMLHPLYLRVDGRPVLFIYRIQAMPNPKRTLRRWRELWAAHGLTDVQIIKADTHANFDDPHDFGADSACEFLPHGLVHIPKTHIKGSHEGNEIWAYEDVMRHCLSAQRPAWRRYECVVPNWDNTPRRGDGRSVILHGSTPDLYERWLTAVYRRAPADGIVLINAWNEWAEGAHLEPDIRYGDAYLKATARAIGVVDDHPGEVATPIRAGPASRSERLERLYMDGLEVQTRLQRRLSRLEAMFERQVHHARHDAEQTMAALRDDAVVLTREIDRLRARLAEHTRDGDR